MLDRCRIIDLPRIAQSSGSLTFLEQKKHVPFDIKRVYYVYDLKSGLPRGGHAHYESEELAIAIRGSFNIRLDDGTDTATYTLKDNCYGLYMPGLVWRVFEDFSADAAYLILSSELYDGDNYVHDYDEFVALAARGDHQAHRRLATRTPPSEGKFHAQQ